MPKELRQRVIDFSGGENTRLSPYRIAENEGQVSTDTDSLSARLNPIKVINANDQAEGDYYFKNKWISDKNAEKFEPFGNSLILSYLDQRPRFKPSGSPEASSDDITFNATNNTISSPTLNFEEVGFEVGHFVYIQGGGNNNKNFRIASISSGTITIDVTVEDVDTMETASPVTNSEVSLSALVYLGVPPAPKKAPSVSKKEIVAGVSEAREKAYFYYDMYSEYYSTQRSTTATNTIGNSTTIDSVYFPFATARYVHQTASYVHLLGYGTSDTQARITTYSINTTTHAMTFVWTVMVDHYETEYKFFKNTFIGRNGENASVVTLNTGSTPTVRNVPIFPTSANIDSFVNSSVFTVATDNTFTCSSHGLSVGDKVRFTATSLASPLVATTDYYIKTAPNTNTFTVTTDSDTSNGTELDITTTGTAPQTLHRILYIPKSLTLPDPNSLSFEQNIVVDGDTGANIKDTTYYATKWLNDKKPTVGYDGFVANDDYAYFATHIPTTSYEWEAPAVALTDEVDLPAGVMLVVIAKNLGTGVDAEGWTVSGDSISTSYASINRGSGYTNYIDGGIRNNRNIVIFTAGSDAKIQSTNDKGVGFDVYRPTTQDSDWLTGQTPVKKSDGEISIPNTYYALREGTGTHVPVWKTVTYDCHVTKWYQGHVKENCTTDWRWQICGNDYNYGTGQYEWTCVPNLDYGKETCDLVFKIWSETKWTENGCTKEAWVTEYVEPIWDTLAGTPELFDTNGPKGWSKAGKVKSLDSTKIYRYRDESVGKETTTPIFKSEWVHVANTPTSSVSSTANGVNYAKSGVMYFVTELNLATGAVTNLPLKDGSGDTYSATKQKFSPNEISFKDQQENIINNFMGSKMVWRTSDLLKLCSGNTFTPTDGYITENSSLKISDKNSKIYCVDTRGLNNTTQSASAVAVFGTASVKVHTAMDNFTFPKFLKETAISAYNTISLQYSYNNTYFVLTDTSAKGSGKLQILRCNGEQASQNTIVIDQESLFGDADSRKITSSYISGISNSEPHRYVIYTRKSDSTGSFRIVDAKTVLNKDENKEESAVTVPFNYFLKASGRTVYGAQKTKGLIGDFKKAEYYFVSDFIDRTISDDISSPSVSGTIKKIFRKKGNNLKFHLLIDVASSGNPNSTTWGTQESWEVDLPSNDNSIDAELDADKSTLPDGTDTYVVKNKAWFHSNDSGQVVATSDTTNTVVGVSTRSSSALVFTASSKTITDGAGSGTSFTNFGEGQSFQITGSGSNNKIFTVATFTDASTITVNETVVDESNPTNAVVTPLITQEIRIKETGQSTFNNVDWAVMRKNFSTLDTDIQENYFSALMGEYDFSGSTRPSKSVLNASSNTMNEVDWKTGIFVWTADNADQPYIYRYSYVDGNGLEGAPSPESDEVDLNDTDEYNYLDNFEAPLPDNFIKKIRLYRVGGNTLDYKLIDTLDIPANGITSLTVYDTKKEEDLISLSPKYDAHPPIGIDDPNKIFKFITQVNGTFMGAEGGNIVFSEYGTPHSFPIAKTKTETVFRGISGLDSEITNLIEFNGECVAFTEGNLFKIRGFDFSSMHTQRMPDNQGLPKSYHNSLVKAKNLLIWANRNGVCAFDGNSINVITQSAIGEFPALENPVATVKDNVYYIFQNATSKTSRGLMVDFRLGRPVVTGISLKSSKAFLVPETNTLYTSSGALGDGLYSSFIYQSREYDFGNLNSDKVFIGADISYKNFLEDIGISNDNTVSFTAGGSTGTIAVTSGAFSNMGVGDFIRVSSASTASNNTRYEIISLSGNATGKTDFRSVIVAPSPETETAGSFVTIKRANDLRVAFYQDGNNTVINQLDGAEEVILPYSGESVGKKNLYLSQPRSLNALSFGIKGTGSVYEVGVKAMNPEDYKNRMLWMGYDVTYQGTVKVGAMVDGFPVLLADGGEEIRLENADQQQTARVYFGPATYGFIPSLFNRTEDTGYIIDATSILVPEKYYRGLRDFTEGQITYSGSVFTFFYLDGKFVQSNSFIGEVGSIKTEKFYFPSGTRGNVFEYRQKYLDVNGDVIDHLNNYIISLETDQALTDQEMPQQETPNG